MVRKSSEKDNPSESPARGRSLKWVQADALLALLRDRHPSLPLRLDRGGWAWLRERGLTRGDARRALDLLAAEGDVRLVSSDGVVVVVKLPAFGRAGA